MGSICLRESRDPSLSMSSSITFRISRASDTSDNVVHVDSVNSDVYAGVIYLNTPEQCANMQGTILYKHMSGYRSPNKEQLSEIIVSKQNKDLSYWTPELVSYITWNRLVLYPANYFHGMIQLG